VGRGNRRLTVRLPPGHWVWTIADPAERSARVKEALEFYRRFAETIEEIRRAVAGLGAVAASGRGAAGERPAGDERLLGSLDRFLDI